MKAIIFSCQSRWGREKAGNPKLIGRMRGAEKVGDWVRSSLSLNQLLTDSWEYEMRLWNEKYSYFFFWIVLNPDKENGWWFQFWHCIKSDKILNWSQNTDCLYHYQDEIGCSHLRSKKKRKDRTRFITKKTQIDIFKMTPPTPSFHQIIHQIAELDVYSRTRLALILRHQTNENSSHDITHWLLDLQSVGAKQNPLKSLMTAGHSSNTHTSIITEVARRSPGVLI